MNSENDMIVSPDLHGVPSPPMRGGTPTTPTTGRSLPVLPKGKTYKSDGDGNPVVVDDPDYLNDDGAFRKHRGKQMAPHKKAKRKKPKKTHRR